MQEYDDKIMGPCTYRAKYTLLITPKKGRPYSKNVCGVHKNGIIRHSGQVGYDVEVRHLTTASTRPQQRGLCLG